ncbi:MAG: DUF1003 domain-containing protein [Candidatus Woesearchaeota archaeon]
MKKRGFNILPKSLKAKHKWGDKVYVSGVYECSLCGNYEAFKKNEYFSECQDCINSKRSKENQWYSTNEMVYFISKNIDIEFDKLTNISIKIADSITEYAGTIGFFLIHVLWFTFWILANTGWFGPEYMFDPFPYGLLTMVVSLEAIFLSTIILMSQNVTSKKDEMRSEHEYQVNLETEKNVAEILAMVKDIRKENSIRTEHLVDLKETVEEISDQIEENENNDNKTKDEEPTEITPEDLEDHVEKHEKESFEEQEDLLEEIGIDMVPESAPTAILEEEGIIEDKDEENKEDVTEKKKERKVKQTSKSSKKKSNKNPKTSKKKAKKK